jgi:hypothetical protein
MAERGGQPGNQNATKSKPFWHAIDRAIAQEDGRRLREAAEKLLNAAAAGESWAIKELADRLDGKAHQAVEVSGDMTVRSRATDLSDDELAKIAKNAGAHAKT